MLMDFLRQIKKQLQSIHIHLIFQIREFLLDGGEYLFCMEAETNENYDGHSLSIVIDLYSENKIGVKQSTLFGHQEIYKAIYKSYAMKYAKK